MKKTAAFFALALTVILNSCAIFSSISYSEPEILITNNFLGDSIAVFDFAAQGSYLPASSSKYVADKLTEIFFLKGKFRIIDRASVRKAQISLSMLNPEVLDKNKLKKFGEETGAKYITLGSLFQNTNTDFLDPDAKKTLKISFRIISVETGEVTGVAAISAKYKGNPSEVIESMINKIVEEIRQVM